ncbi:MAG: hypothetical protein ABFD79_02195 [Phycisphaerales bacterium]
MAELQQARIIEMLTDIFDEFKIGYAIGGSVASSIFGTPRFTQDADITALISLTIVEKLYEKLNKIFYVSKDAMYAAVRSKSSFNIIHLDTVFKIDIFIPSSEFENQLICRGSKNKIDESIEKEFSLASPEDVILLKLKWYKAADCISDRQWSDVKGVLMVQKQRLDYDYLNTWASKLGLADLFQKAILEINSKE